MGKLNKIALGLVVVIFVFLQLIFIFSDHANTPGRVAVDFTKAFYRFDPSMANLLCEEALIVEGINVVDQHIYDAIQAYKQRGFGRFYASSHLHNIKTTTTYKDQNTAEVHLTGDRKYTLRSLWTKQSFEIDEIFQLVKIDGQWKICGDMVMLTKGRPSPL